MAGSFSDLQWPMIRILAGLVMACLASCACYEKPEWGHFPKGIVSRLDPGDTNAVLLEPFEFVDSSGERWVAPPWTETKRWYWNGASIPRLFLSVTDGQMRGCHRNASVIHDYHYWTRGDGTVSRKEADHLYYEMCLAGGVGKINACMQYLALRLGGKQHWEGQGAVTLTRADLEPLYAAKQRLIDRDLRSVNAEVAEQALQSVLSGLSELDTAERRDYALRLRRLEERRRNIRDRRARLAADERRLEQELLDLERSMRGAPPGQVMGLSEDLRALEAGRGRLEEVRHQLEVEDAAVQQERKRLVENQPPVEVVGLDLGHLSDEALRAYIRR